MSERPRKLRKTEHGREVVDIEKDKAEMDKPARKKPSTTDATTEKVDHPKEPIKPQTEKSNIGHGHRKRRAAPVDVIEPKKLALSEKTAPASAEKDSPNADELLRRQLQNLNIDQNRRDHRIQGSVPRPLPEILVVQDPSGYIIAQATFHVPRKAPGRSGDAVAGGSGDAVAGGSGDAVAGGSGESVPGGSGATVPGGSGATVPGGSGTAVPGGSDETLTGGCGEAVTGGSSEVEPGRIPISLPMIAIQAREERFAKTIAQFNDTIPEVDSQLPIYKFIVEVIPDYVKKKRLELMSEFFRSKSSAELDHFLDRSLMQSCYRLDCAHDILNNYIQLIEPPFGECLRIKKLLWEIYSTDNTSARPTHLTERARRHLRELETLLQLMPEYIKRCNKEVEVYHTEKLKLDRHSQE